MSPSRQQDNQAQLLTKLAAMLQADGLPGVALTNDPWRKPSEETLRLLAHAQAGVYVRHGELVRIQRKEDGTPFIETLGPAALKGILARSMNFVKWTSKGLFHVAPPDSIVKDILALGSWPFPPLDAIIEFPVLRPNGTVITTPGYDAATRLYYAPLPTLHVPPIPEEPTPDEVMNALGLLYEAIGQFPFQDSASYANTLALLLTPLVRQAINGHVPIALIDATRPGTGKSLLAETVARIATGRNAAMMAAPYDDDEWRKRIASTLAEGATIIVIDNIRARLQSASLDLTLTSFTVKERVLGESRNGTYAQRATWMATGNNIQIGGDLPRRSYWIRLDAHTDKPWTRHGFKHNLETWVPEHRGELIAALLTLARAWYVAGKPAPDVPRTLGSFQSWADTVGGILSCCYTDDFQGNMDALHQQADEDATQWAAFLHAWYEFYEDAEILASTLARDIKAGADDDSMIGVSVLFQALPDDLTDLKRGDFRRKLGKAIAQRVGTHFDESGLHLVRARTDGRSGSAYWKVERSTPPPAPTPTPDEHPASMTAEDQPASEELSSDVAQFSEQPAPPAGIASPAADEDGERWEHLHLYDYVQTPRGEGVIVQNWHRQVKVSLSKTGATVTFEHPDEIQQIVVRGATSPPQQVPGPDEWPYNDPAMTDDLLTDYGFLSRKDLGYPPLKGEHHANDPSN